MFVDQVSRTLAYLERVIVEKDNLAQSLVDEVNDLSEELNTMQSTLEVSGRKVTLLFVTRRESMLPKMLSR